MSGATRGGLCGIAIAVVLTMVFCLVLDPPSWAALLFGVLTGGLGWPFGQLAGEDWWGV